MEDYIPDVQERLRRAGYPRFAQAQTQQIRIGPALNASALVNTSTKWLFGDRDNTTAVAIAPEFVLLETIAYDTFDVFVQQFSAALTIVAEVVKVDLAERVGLRYLDAVRPLGTDALVDYLAPGIQGLSLEGVGLSEQRGRYILEGKTAVGAMRVRLTRGRGRVPVPLDLQPPDLAWPNEPGQEYALLDFDHYQLGTIGYKTRALVDLLWALHDPIDGAFREAVTPLAMDRWEATDVGG
jgi:uncharacterized protein (TIGR04255 family)